MLVDNLSPILTIISQPLAIIITKNKYIEANYLQGNFIRNLELLKFGRESFFQSFLRFFFFPNTLYIHIGRVDDATATVFPRHRTIDPEHVRFFVPVVAPATRRM